MKLRRLTVEPAENGFTVEKSYEPGPEERYMEPERTVHESIEGVLGCVKDCLANGKTKKGKKREKLDKANVEVATRGRY